MPLRSDSTNITEGLWTGTCHMNGSCRGDVPKTTVCTLSGLPRKTADYLNYPVLTNVRFLRSGQQPCVDTKQPIDKMHRKLA
jgi:hypothetical protein